MLELFYSGVNLWLAHPIGQSLGFAASLAYFIAALQKDDKRLFGFMLCGTIFWLLHYGLLGAWVASVGFIIGAIRNGLAYFKLVTPPRRLWLTLVLVGAYAVVGIFYIHAWYDFLPVIGSSLYVIASYNLVGIRMRLLFLLAQAAYTIYALYVSSIAGVLDGLIDTLLTCITMYRMMHDVTKQAVLAEP